MNDNSKINMRKKTRVSIHPFLYIHPCHNRVNSRSLEPNRVTLSHNRAVSPTMKKQSGCLPNPYSLVIITMIPQVSKGW